MGTLGHSQKSGRADICVMNENGTATLFIIECKTYGEEYVKALNILKQDGGQLFSYAQQEKATKWICLYASDYNNDVVKYNIESIFVFDDIEKINEQKSNKTIQLFENANTKEELFRAWKNTYEEKFCNDVIFSDETIAYNIGEKPLRKKDLKEFNPDDKIVNKFEEILRHNNVSDKENAFNRLVALFICKLVDELSKEEDDIVEFQYKVGTDTYESLQDRLQRLYKKGMEEFLKEDVFYVESEYPTKLFSTYKGANRKYAIEELKKTFKKLKFYSNNEFAFKEVHNELLFNQNGKILVEVVQLFEKYKIVYNSKHQFLGDLFEQLLNKGFKQNEGQFFTPMPITRFIWESLPLENIIKNNKGNQFPYIIDYACGSGHFLTEGIDIINKLMNNKNNDWVSQSIYGIEKDYRLARVSKISLFMNGAGGGNIIFGDGLENDSSKGIENGKFDILVANPPYSVKAFKSHLKLENNDFELLNRISNDGGEIEILFIERISQLVKPNGIAAIILPSSILSNNSNSYVGAREILLKNFKIHAITQFGSKTFGATGTNTVVLFLKKYDESPKKYEMIQDSILNIFNDECSSEWGDTEIFTEYINHIGVEKNIYISFIKANKEYRDFLTNDYFKMYVDSFDNSTVAKNINKKKISNRYTEEDKSRELKQKFYSYVKNIEQDKIFYFAIVKDNETLIITAPTDNVNQKEFLGYDWSNRKGSEGIQIIKLGGMLFDKDNRESENHIAPIIRKTFEGKLLNKKINNTLTYNKIYNMIDFFDVNFSKALNLKTNNKIDIKSKYPIVNLKDFNNGNIEIKKGTSIIKDKANQNGKIKVVAGGRNFAYYHDTFNRNENIITISASGAYAGYVNFYKEKIFASDCTTIWQKDFILNRFVYYYLKSIQDKIYVLQKGSGQPHVYPTDIEKIPIPTLPKEQIKNLVSQCDNLEKKYETTRMKIEEYQNQIKNIFKDLEIIENIGGGYRLSDKNIFNLGIGKRVVQKELIDKGIPVYSANVFEPMGYIDKSLINRFDKYFIIWGIDGDWMVNILPPNFEFYPTDHCGYMTVNENIINPRYMAYILEKEGRILRFSRTYRASLDRIKSIQVKVPSIDVQNEAMYKVLELENEIERLNNNQIDLQKEISIVIKNFI